MPSLATVSNELDHRLGSARCYAIRRTHRASRSLAGPAPNLVVFGEVCRYSAPD